jgi:co-chaperonin GroES (HSP10)
MNNHSNRQPIGDALIVFLDEIRNHKSEKSGLWTYGRNSFEIGVSEIAREEEARKATTGIVLAIGAAAFKDIEEHEKPRVGDRVTFTSYSGMHKVEGEYFYRSLKDKEIHDYYIPQRKQLEEKCTQKSRKKK